MAARSIPSSTSLLKRPTVSSSSSLCTCINGLSIPSRAAGRRNFSQTPAHHANLIKRPRRPYSFTQMIQLSDGSTYTMRTTSPVALYKSAKDTRNHLLWQPTDKSLRNVEVDEAGKLAAFRSRFGHAFDAEEAPEPTPEELAAAAKGKKKSKTATGAAAAAAPSAATTSATDAPASSGSAFDTLGDLIASYSSPEDEPKVVARPPPKKGSKK